MHKTARVYIMEAEDGSLKVGHSARPELRLKEIKERGPLRIVHLCDESDNADRIERLAHKLLALAGRRIKGEWFAATIEECAASIDHAGRIIAGLEPAPDFPPGGKASRLDMRITSELREALQRCADRERRRLTDYVEIVLTDHVAEIEKREGKRK